jgi:hypothetical protein
MKTVAQKEPKRVVAYPPFATFLSAIEGWSAGLPHRIDTSLWLSYSPAIRAQLVGAFRFLNLIDAEGKPSDTLKAMVRDKTNRKAILREVLRTSYSRITSLDLTKISPRQFDLEMRKFGMKGETHKKVVFFFLKAARYAELPLSPLLGRKTRGATRKLTREVGPAPTGSPHPISAQRTSERILLKSGGVITLDFEGNILDLDHNDRSFFFHLFDKLREYRKDNQS